MLTSLRRKVNQTHTPTMTFALFAIIVGVLSAVLAVVIANPLYIVAGVMLLGGSYFVFVHAEDAIPALVFIIYIRLSDVLQQTFGLPSTAKLIIALFLGLIAVRWLVTRKEPTGWHTPVILAGIYGLVLALSLVYAGDQERTLESLDEYVRNVLVIIIIAVLVQRMAQFHRVIWALLAAGVFLGTITVVQQLTGTYDNTYGGFALASVQHIIGDVNDHRAAGPIGDPNFYAQIMVALVPLALERFWNSRTLLMRLFASAALAASGLAIVFTFSRGAFLASAVVVAIMFVRRPPRLPMVLVALLAVMILVRFIPDEYVERLQTIPEAIVNFDTETTSEVSFRGRVSEMTVAWNMFVDYPLLGVGVNNYPALYQNYSRSLGLDSRREQRPPHNLYLEIAAESGLVGLAAFGLVVVYIFRRLGWAESMLAAANRPGDASLLWAFRLSLVGYFLCGMFLHSAFPRYLWLLLGLAMILPQIVQNEVTSEGNHGK